MKKFITLLSAAFIAVASLATVASAAPVEEDIFKPKATLDIVDLDEGAAVIAISYEINEELGIVDEGTKYVPKVTGSALTAWQIDITFNKEILDVDNTVLYLPVAGTYNGDFKNALGSSDKVVDMGVAVIPVQPEYADKTVEELNALDFATIDNVIVEITQWDAAKKTADFVTQTKYRTDGDGDYVPSSRVGAEPVTPPTPPAPTASVAIKGAYKTTDAAWIAEKGNTMFWGVDFANGGFNGTAVAKIFSDAKERELTIATPADAEINGEASFGVFVIVGDSTDAIGLTITSGDVTATAAPVAYADAE